MARLPKHVVTSICLQASLELNERLLWAAQKEYDQILAEKKQKQPDHKKSAEASQPKGWGKGGHQKAGLTLFRLTCMSHIVCYLQGGNQGWKSGSQDWKSGSNSNWGSNSWRKRDWYEASGSAWKGGDQQPVKKVSALCSKRPCVCFMALPCQGHKAN